MALKSAHAATTEPVPAVPAGSVPTAPAPPEVGGLPWIEDAGKVAPKDARALSKLFFDQLQVLEEGTHEYQYARNTLIEMNLSLVRFAASRFRHRGSGEMEDITQVGTIGLIKAIDRFDLSREVEFTTFAVPYIVGEIKRFFRDTSWAVHVPRRLQELRVEIAKGKEHLAVLLDRDPTVAELAAHLDLTEDEIVEGIVASNGYTAGSLDMPNDSGSDSQAAKSGRTFADVLGEPDPAMETVEDLHALAPLLHTLDSRERRIVEMRFGEELTQAQIGEQLGISQMHVSRLLARILKRLRSGMLVED
ncbi:RNA polymerase sigma factor SigF [Streptomyces sp. NBC_01387]|uniref:RNA polymerase sigma factor SigF n=1 Tax=unclassified Streptomyces TaxID=2593676 RepID=UPI0020254A93|nr:MULTISPECIES: RNA polymerase sigma factor SigF [unclassified Streptomyces]MCX4550334.1 RNA polymerase sigma factor SigF [Streptomyces sp. NBC_01500]WSC21827.1 RNA polymerase sigma factor SigF [Streptomyces sp. NBC_01766]WSV55782.1 RNA polymerase sigma factor SigF [Streptomyces sp. NBC_01014]